MKNLKELVKHPIKFFKDRNTPVLYAWTTLLLALFIIVSLGYLLVTSFSIVTLCNSIMTFIISLIYIETTFNYDDTKQGNLNRILLISLLYLFVSALF